MSHLRSTRSTPSPSTPSTTVAKVALLVGLLITVSAGCAGGAADQAEPDRTATTAVAAPTTSTTVAPPNETTPAPEPAVRIARSAGALTVRTQPDEGAPVLTELPATTVFGSPRALLVVDDADGWLEVQVPQRPNGGTGWVEAEQVELTAGTYAVTVDRATRTLRVREAATDEVVLETAVAIGAPDAPTPTGTFAVVDRLETPNPTGAYGPFALGLSGFSETLSEFGGGNGQIAIHGTDDPTSIGRDVSHGCIRVPNDVVLRLADLLPLGTPVTIS